MGHKHALYYQIFCWINWLIVLVVHLVDWKKNSNKSSKYLLVIFVIRNLLTFFDLENSRDRMNNVEMFIFLFQNMAFITVQLTLIICLHSKPIYCPVVFISIIGAASGLFVFMSDSEKNQETLKELLMSNIEDFVYLCFIIFGVVQLQVFYYHIFIYELSYELEKKQLVQNEKEKIMENLEEAIITRSGGTINYINRDGFDIIQDIMKFGGQMQKPLRRPSGQMASMRPNYEVS